MTRRAVSTLCAFGLLAGLAGVAEADQHRYVGVHPIAESAGGGVCHIRLPHVHVYAPTHAKVAYRDHRGWKHFVGDPVAHGYEGPRHAYHGAHPIHVDVVVEDDDWDRGHHHVEWCYLKGPHHHVYEPGVSASFEAKGDVYWYVGDYPPAFERRRNLYGRINVVYEPIEYERPEIVVEPPSGYVNVLVVSDGPPRHRPPGHSRGRGRSGVRFGIEVPAPSIEVGVGASFGIGHSHDRRHRKHKKFKRHRKHRKHKKFKRHRKHRKHRKFRGRD